MSTNCFIAAKFDSSVVESDEIIMSWCHYDGYLSGVGRTLIENYSNEDSAFEIAAGGKISSLNDDYFTEDESSIDCPESFIVCDSESSMIGPAKNSGAEYLYLWEDGEWYFFNLSVEFPLKEVLNYSKMLPEFEWALEYAKKQTPEHLDFLGIDIESLEKDVELAKS